MCVATGPVQVIYVVVGKATDDKVFSEELGGKTFIKGYFSRRDWAEEYRDHWNSHFDPTSRYTMDHYKFEVEEHQLDWWMRCH